MDWDYHSDPTSKFEYEYFCDPEGCDDDFVRRLCRVVRYFFRAIAERFVTYVHSARYAFGWEGTAVVAGCVGVAKDGGAFHLYRREDFFVFP